MAIKLDLSSLKILEKQFTFVSRGYNALEVDQFLDRIINDYKKVEANLQNSTEDVSKLKLKVKELTEENRKLSVDLASYKQRMKGIETNKNVSLDNIDLIKRINALETFLCRNGYDPNLIK